jgi:uncharacterized protein YegL
MQSMVRLGTMNELELVQLADNPDPRAPCLLLLDTSASMSGEPLRALNEGLQTFHRDVLADDLAKRRVEVAIVTFGHGGTQIAQDFVTVDEWTPPLLKAGGSTPLGEALETGLTLLRSRKDLYKRAGLQYYRPWVFLITDGEPTDTWQDAAQKAPSSRPPLKLKGLQFAELFSWLSQSQQRVSHSRVGDQLALPPIGWADVST